MRSLPFTLFVCFIILHDARATTWNEPWHEAYLKTGADQETGFGGEIMDPRVGTYCPDSVKA